MSDLNSESVEFNKEAVDVFKHDIFICSLKTSDYNSNIMRKPMVFHEISTVLTNVFREEVSTLFQVRALLTIYFQSNQKLLHNLFDK